MREQVTSKKQLVTDRTIHVAQIEEVFEDEEEELMTTHACRVVSDGPPYTMPHISSAQPQYPPPGSRIADDPIEQYYKQLAPGEQPEASELYVANEAHQVRTFHATIDNRVQVECIVDPGSMVISMSEAVCHDLHLHYDPTVIIHMRSANGSVGNSLGLARNVPFMIGNITLYLQVHILRTPAYNVLLGCPFDVLTQSVVRNFANEDQTITVLDPNSGRIATIPMMPRTRSKKKRHTPQCTENHMRGSVKREEEH